MKHTPGPWNLRPDPDDQDAWVIVDGSHSAFQVCSIAPRFEPKEELRNARLIAAAPEMLDALRLISECSPIPGPGFSLVLSMVSVALKAIARSQSDGEANDKG